MEQSDDFIKQCDLIEELIRYKFQDRKLLTTAFTHRSYFLDKKEEKKIDNERLEFLGDSVLNLIVSTLLFSDPKENSEGILTQLKEQIVDAPSLREYTNKLGIGKYCLMGKGEQGKLSESSILSDLFEAILGAVYVDGGFKTAEKFFLDHFQDIVDMKIASPRRNWKKELQEYAQREYQELPQYQTTGQSGPAHRKEFRVSVEVHKKVIGTGRGMSKKEAEMSAAQDAIVKQEKEAREGE